MMRHEEGPRVIEQIHQRVVGDVIHEHLLAGLSKGLEGSRHLALRLLSHEPLLERQRLCRGLPRQH